VSQELEGRQVPVPAQRRRPRHRDEGPGTPGPEPGRVERSEQEPKDDPRYLEVFDNALDQMILLEIRGDGRFRILAVNRAMEQAMGLPRSEVVGRFQDELYHGEVDRLLSDCYRACIEAGSPIEGELDLPLPAGRRLYRATTVPARDEAGRIVRVVNIVRDITQERESWNRQERLNRALKTLSSGNETLIRAVDEASLLSGMCHVMVDVGGYRRAWIGYPDRSADGRPQRETDLPPDPAGAELMAVVQVASAGAAGEEPPAARPDPVVVRLVGPPPEDVRTGVGTGASACPGAGACLGGGGCPGAGACLTMPLVHDGEVLGVFVVHTMQAQAFEPDERRLLGELADDLAYGIHNLRNRAAQAQHEQRLRRAMSATIQALADTTELRDPYTAGHQRRVAQLAREVGRLMGLPEDQVAGLYLASMIHDIGKICVPAEILGRPGRLSPLEYAMVQQHVVAAYELLKGIEFPWPVAEIVGQHHERCDGSGYPNGLLGEQQLPESRILAVCDVVEAMSSHRPYRPGLGMEAALDELQAHRGTQYDATVVDACVTLIRSGQFTFEQGLPAPVRP
jgi:PAS domain S-box-containing protein